MTGVNRANKIEAPRCKPRFDIRGGRAWCLKGTSVADLFEAKKQTVLAARGIFKKGSE